MDYKVDAIYQGDELIPRQIQLHYVGIDQNGNLIPIIIGGKSTQDEVGVSHVTLDNVAPNATIDYLTGTATGTVASAAEQQRAQQTTQEAEAKRLAEEQATQEAEAKRLAEEQAAQEVEARRLAEEQARQERTVYIARNGTAEVYWYSLDSMPHNTNFNKVIAVTEAEAIQWGKRHTTKE